MIENEEARKNGWTQSERKPGYLTKTVKHNNCTIIINRPRLSPEEQKNENRRLSKRWRMYSAKKAVCRRTKVLTKGIST